MQTYEKYDMCMYIMCHFIQPINAWTDLSKLPKVPSLGKLKAKKVKELNSSSDTQLLEEAPQMLLSGLYLSHVVPLKSRLKDVGM